MCDSPTSYIWTWGCDMSRTRDGFHLSVNSGLMSPDREYFHFSDPVTREPKMCNSFKYSPYNTQFGIFIFILMSLYRS